MDRLPTPVFLGFPCEPAGKESTCNAGDLGSIPGSERSPGERKGYPLQYSSLENSMDCIVSPWCCKQSDMAEQLSLSIMLRVNTVILLYIHNMSTTVLSYHIIKNNS